MVGTDAQPKTIAIQLEQHPGWNRANGWKPTLNNLRLVIEPSVILNMLKPWLNLFPIPRLSAGLECLVALTNQVPGSLPCHHPFGDLRFSSA